MTTAYKYPAPPPADTWRAEVVPLWTRTLAAILDLRDEICPECELIGPGIDERQVLVQVAWTLSRGALEEAVEDLEWHAIEHLYAHARWRTIARELA